MDIQANLVEKHYLHSSKWNFYKAQSNLAARLNIFNKAKDNKGLDAAGTAYKMIAQEKNIAEARERSFFKNFDGINNFHCSGDIITDAAQWTKCFLIDRSSQNTSKVSELQKILQSKTLYDLMGKKDLRPIITSIQNSLRGIKDTKKMQQEIDKILKTNIENLSLGDILHQIGFLDPKKKGLAGIQQEVLSKVVSQLGNSAANDFNKLKIRNKMTSKTGRIKEVESILRRYSKGDFGNIPKCLDYIDKQMRAKKIFSDSEIIETKKMWETLAGKNIIALGTGLVKAGGEAQEISRIISMSDIYITIPDSVVLDESFFIAGHKTLAKRTADELVYRYNSDAKKWAKSAQSKIDTTVVGKDGTVYFLQEKNTVSSLFDSFIETGDISKLPTKPGQMKLSEEISFETIKKYFTLPINGEAPLLQKDELDFLIYLLVNVNLLNIWSAESVGGTKLKKAGEGKAAVSTAMIDSLITRGIRAFIGDFIFKDESNFDTAEIKNWDFVIYRSEILFPLSVILQQMLDYLTSVKAQLMSIRTFHGIRSGFVTETDLKDLYILKRQIIGIDPDNTPNYHNTDLVDIGSSIGNIAEQGLYIKNIKIMFNEQAVRNLITPETILRR